MLTVNFGVFDITVYMSFIQISVDTISDDAKISASQDDLVILFCLYDFHNIGPRPKLLNKVTIIHLADLEAIFDQ